MSRFLLVDASPLIYAVHNTQGHLATTKGEPTGLRYGFLRSVNSFRKRTNADKVVIVFDAPGKVKKAQDAPFYKSDRTFTDDKRKMYDQVPALRELITLTNWTQIDAPGYEADDVIGAIAQAKAPRGHEVVIVSTDNDLCQLIQARVRIFMPAKKDQKKDQWKDDNFVKAEFGVWPEHLLTWRALIGDKSDNIPGIQGFTPALFDALKARLNDLPRQPVDGAFFYTHVVRAMIEDANDRDRFREQFQRNYNLMRLHRPNNDELIPIQGLGDRAALTNAFVRLEFKSMMEHVEAFCGANPAV